jgi:ABC-2 type transport system permease protein
MSDIGEKYKIYEKKFGNVNWIGFWTLYKKEVLRFLIVVIQTIISPLVTSLLFLLVLSLAIGNDRGEVTSGDIMV